MGKQKKKTDLRRADSLKLAKLEYALEMAKLNNTQLQLEIKEKNL